MAAECAGGKGALGSQVANAAAVLAFGRSAHVVDAHLAELLRRHRGTGERNRPGAVHIRVACDRGRHIGNTVVVRADAVGSGVPAGNSRTQVAGIRIVSATGGEVAVAVGDLRGKRGPARAGAVGEAVRLADVGSLEVGVVGVAAGDAGRAGDDDGVGLADFVAIAAVDDRDGKLDRFRRGGGAGDIKRVAGIGEGKAVAAGKAAIAGRGGGHCRDGVGTDVRVPGKVSAAARGIERRSVGMADQCAACAENGQRQTR